MQEKWKIINGFGQRYLISNYGRIKSTYKGEKIRKTGISAGYESLTLYYNGYKHTYTVHALVAEYFLEKPESNEKLEINHKDENPLNNNVNNLEWVTHKENINYGNRTKKASISKSIPIICQNIKTLEIYEFNSGVEAETRGFGSKKSINACCNKKRKTHKGYVWKFKNDKTPFECLIKEANNSNQPTKKPVIGRKNNVIYEFDSVHRASKELGILSGNIYRCALSNNNKPSKEYKYKGYVWNFTMKEEGIKNG